MPYGAILLCVQLKLPAVSSHSASSSFHTASTMRPIRCNKPLSSSNDLPSSMIESQLFAVTARSLITDFCHWTSFVAIFQPKQTKIEFKQFSNLSSYYGLHMKFPLKKSIFSLLISLARKSQESPAFPRLLRCISRKYTVFVKNFCRTQMHFLIMIICMTGL